MRQGRFGHGGEAVGADVVRNLEGLAAESVQKIAGDGFTRRKADGVYEAVKAWPMGAQVGHELVDLCIAKRPKLINGSDIPQFDYILVRFTWRLVNNLYRQLFFIPQPVD